MTKVSGHNPKKLELTDHPLFRIESKLNRLHYNGIEIGGLLAHDFIASANESSQGAQHSMRKLFKMFLAPLLEIFQKQDHTYSLPDIIYFQSGNSARYNKIFESLNINEEILQLIAGNCSLFSIKETLKVGSDAKKRSQDWLLKNKERFFEIFKEENYLEESIQFFFQQLSKQILKVEFWLNQLKANPNVKLIAGDFDRNRHSAPLFLVARCLGIKTLVIQHGAGNGEFGMTPLLANHLMVWGEMYKKQFEEAGVSSEQITITGTPTVEIDKFEQNAKELLYNKWEIESENTVVLAINPVKEDDIKRQLRDFHLAVKDTKGINAFVKMHPAQNEDQIRELVKTVAGQDIKLLPKSMPIVDFLNLCDVLITHNSGIANEAIAYGIPVIILDNLSQSAGNGLWLHRYLNIPLAKNHLELSNEIEKSINSKNMISDEMIELIYFRTGDASSKIINEKTQQILASQ